MWRHPLSLARHGRMLSLRAERVQPLKATSGVKQMKANQKKANPDCLLLRGLCFFGFWLLACRVSRLPPTSNGQRSTIRPRQRRQGRPCRKAAEIPRKKTQDMTKPDTLSFSVRRQAIGPAVLVAPNATVVLASSAVRPAPRAGGGSARKKADRRFSWAARKEREKRRRRIFCCVENHFILYRIVSFAFLFSSQLPLILRHA